MSTEENFDSFYCGKPLQGLSIIPPQLQHDKSANSMIDASPPSSKVILTTLPYVPGYRVKRYLGPLQLHFIKESWAVRGEGTYLSTEIAYGYLYLLIGLLGTFLYVFLSEIDAAARAQVAALGGNALLCHR